MSGPFEGGITIEAIVAAGSSASARRALDLEHARRAGLPEDEVPAFIARLEEFDLRTPAWGAREAAAAAAHHVQRRAELLELAGLLDERLQPLLAAVDHRLAALVADLDPLPA